MKLILIAVITIAVTLITLFLPGLALFTRYRWLKNTFERIIFAPVVGIAYSSFLAILFYLGWMNRALVVLVVLVVWMTSVLMLYRSKNLIKINKNQLLVLVIVFLFFLSTVFFVAFPLAKSNKYVPDPNYDTSANYDRINVKIINLAHTNANDNYLPYRQAQFFLNRTNLDEQSNLMPEWGVGFFMRTPLMGMVSAHILSILTGEISFQYPWREVAEFPQYDYLMFQIIAQFLNALVFLSGYLLLEKLFSRRVALISLCVMALSGFFIYNTFYTWPKSFTAFLILGAFYLAYAKRQFFFAGTLMGMAYMAHDLALFFMPGILLLAVNSRVLKHSAISVLKSIAPFILILLPWNIISRFIYGQESVFYYYPFAINGLPFSKDTVISEFFNTPITQILYSKLQSLAFLVLPFQFIFEKASLLEKVATSTIFSLPGAAGLAIIPLSVWGIVTNLKKTRILFFGIIFIPLLCAISLIGWPKGLGALHFAQATVVLLIGYAASRLIKLRDIMKAAILILLIAQLIMFSLYSYSVSIPHLSDLNLRVITLLFGLISIYGCIAAILISLLKFGKIQENKYVLMLNRLWYN